MGAPNRGERLQIMLTDDELKAVDDWRFTARMPSRASAVRELLKRGLTAEGFPVAQRGSKSKDYGVIDAAIGHNKSDGKGRMAR
jgi:metal-responsive CopG/Arc/MetJ family transcriptional regulator